MAVVRLGRFEVRHSQLPPVCLCCGSRATEYRRRVFIWHPWWYYLGVPLGLLPYGVLWLFFAWRLRLEAPLCGAHQLHWHWRTAVLILACLLDFGVGLLGWKLYTDPASLIVIDHGISMFLLVLSLGIGPVVLLALGLVLRYSGVHVQEITAQRIVLGGVASEFAEAVQVARRDAEAAQAPAAVLSGP